MDFAEAERRTAALDARYRPVATARVEPSELSDVEAFGRRVTARLAELNADAAEVAAMSSDVDRYGMGSMREILLGMRPGR
ncbi:hypothetical protein [Catellatospora sp. NPDC049609]|uniref:hypothetical protein n=1 Tax=Catellatospora sp. NPDC049609 TaxID=3155505 RepID=UPI003412E221